MKLSLYKWLFCSTTVMNPVNVIPQSFVCVSVCQFTNLFHFLLLFIYGHQLELNCSLYHVTYVPSYHIYNIPIVYNII